MAATAPTVPTTEISKGRKTQLWEGGTRARYHPLAQRINPVHGDVPAGLVDLLPSACAAAGVSLPKNVTLDGTSLLPLFATGKLAAPKPLYWFYNPSRPVCVIRDGDGVCSADPEIDSPRQNMFLERFIGDIKKTDFKNYRLHNLRTDAAQEIDLSEKDPNRFIMKAQMLKLHRDVMDEAFDWRSLK